MLYCLSRLFVVSVSIALVNRFRVERALLLRILHIVGRVACFLD
jgi:hypothetical protein